MTCMHALMDLIVAEGEYQSATTKSHQFANMLLSRLLLALLDGSEDRVRRGKTQCLHTHAHTPLPPARRAASPQASIPCRHGHTPHQGRISHSAFSPCCLSWALASCCLAPWLSPQWPIRFFCVRGFAAGGDGYRICRGLPRVCISAFCPMARTCFWVCPLSIGCQGDPAPTCSLMPIQPSDAPPSHRCQSHCPIRSQTHRPVSHWA